MEREDRGGWVVGVRGEVGAGGGVVVGAAGRHIDVGLCDVSGVTRQLHPRFTRHCKKIYQTSRRRSGAFA